MPLKLSQEEFIAKCIAVHGDIYDYSGTVYGGTRCRIMVGCRIHGPFDMLPQMHADRGYGCPDCSDRVNDTKSFIKAARKVHGYTFDYSETVYVSSKEHLKIMCRVPDHGAFFTTS